MICQKLWQFEIEITCMPFRGKKIIKIRKQSNQSIWTIDLGPLPTDQPDRKQTFVFQENRFQFWAKTVGALNSMKRAKLNMLEMVVT